jgi:hypothetical protein
MSEQQKVATIARRIVALVRQQHDASFVEIERLLGDEAKGQCALEVAPNLVLWAGLSQIVCQAVNDDWLRSQIDIKPVPLLVYITDGKWLKFPVAQRVPKRGYKAPHWIPVVLVAKGEA